jgi:GNAT superfamily N-acetyltransferase
LDGPRALLAQELAPARRLSVRCFNHDTLTNFPDGPYRPTRRQSIEVVAHEGGPVSQMHLTYSHVSVCGYRVKVASIGGVCTHPDYRGRGIATELLHHSLHEAASNGARIVLISGTRGLYRRAGCTPAMDFETVVLTSTFSGGAAAGIGIRPASAADGRHCARLNQMEPVHFVRRVAEFESSIGCADGGGLIDDWIVEADGRPLCYVLLRTPWSHAPQDRVRELVLQGEWAGSRLALVSAFPQIIERCGLVELRLGRLGPGLALGCGHSVVTRRLRPRRRGQYTRSAADRAS